MKGQGHPKVSSPATKKEPDFMDNIDKLKHIYTFTLMSLMLILTCKTDVNYIFKSQTKATKIITK